MVLVQVRLLGREQGGLNAYLRTDSVCLACARCQQKVHLRETCTYVACANDPSLLSRPFSDVSRSDTQIQQSAPSLLPSHTEHLSAASGRSAQDDTEPVGFVSKVDAAISSRLGLPDPKSRCPIPLTDAPLFGDKLSRRHTSDESVRDADNVLPPRRHADYLIDIYWRHLEPCDPLFDQKCFYHSYQLLYTDGELNCDERVFVSILNAIFALSTQWQEIIPAEKRTETSEKFFQRAWYLLGPETIVWKLPTVETVGCLLLLARYLQCTRNLHQTWMAVGSAVRMAESLGLHLLNDASPETSPEDVQVARQMWQCCVNMDRYENVSPRQVLGRG